MSKLQFVFNEKENTIIASYKFNNCKFSSQKSAGCRCSKKIKEIYNFCSKKNIKISTLHECLNCNLFELK
jgi:hypothetical protein